MTTLPGSIATALDGFVPDDDNQATSGVARVVRCVAADGAVRFLKIQLHPDGAVVPGLAPEAAVLRWLDGRLGAPRVVAFHQQGNTQYLVTDAVPGIPAHRPIPDVAKPRAVEQMAAALRNVHALDVTGCPYDRRAATVLAHGRAHAGSPHVPDDERDEMQSALEQLRDLPVPAEQVVFTHGDYCCPNILLDGHMAVTGPVVAGLVDWGYAGLGDPHRDYIAAEFSIARNLGDAWVAPFFDALGTPVDEQRLHVHRLLYCLW